MRKPRVVIFDDEVFILNLLKDFFVLRGYEVLSYSDPTMVCPLFGAGGDVCTHMNPCCDVMITDFLMPGVNGVELLEHQLRKGCALDVRNKAVISGYVDGANRDRIREISCMFFQKPFTIFALSEWLDRCEQRMDLSRPLASRRKEERFESYREISFNRPGIEAALTAVAVNISHSGLCLKVPAPLQTTDTINIHAGHFPTCRRASVRWVKPLGNGNYLAGLHCSP